jgi:uncharacterized protein YbjT (DUF2867 family)
MTILITGPSGHVGRSVLDQLTAADEPVRALLHQGAPTHLPGRVEAVDGDLARPETLGPALDGVRKVFLYGKPESMDGFVTAATEAGVAHVVALSSASVTRNAEANPIARKHLAVERALAGSTLATTILRPAAFAANTLQWAPSIRAEGVVRAPYANAYVVPIHEADIAAVAVAALTGGGHEGATYLLTGPEAITQRRQVELISQTLGRPVRFEEQTAAEARAEMIRFMPPETADTVLGYLAATERAPGPVTDTVQQVTGRPARDYLCWVNDHLAEFAE